MSQRAEQSDLGDATVAVSARDRESGVELWAVNDRGHLWEAYHETYAFCWAHLSLSEQSWIYRGRRYGATTRTTMLIEPGEIHRTVRGGRAGFHVLFLHPQFVVKMLDGKLDHFREGQTSEPAVRLAFADACRSVAGGLASKLAKEESLLQFLCVTRAMCAERPGSQCHCRCRLALRRVREFLQDRCDEDVTLDKLSEVAGLTKYHLDRIFHREFGVPIHRYQTLVRLSRSKGYLLSGMPIAEAASRVGFFDQSHFHRAFRKLYGMTPGSFCTNVRMR